jgi:hypothetical protein
MNEPDNFLARWSRRKRGVADGSTAREEPAGPDASGRADASDREVVPERADAPERPVEGREPLVDLDKLPSLDSITADTDISGFLAPGVPEELKAAALRRVWVADSRIRDFVGLADYDWDFHKPGAIPGFGPLSMNEDLRREIARIAGDSMSKPDSAKPAVENKCGVVELSQQVAVANDEIEPRAGQPDADRLAPADGAAEQAIAAAQPDIPRSKSVELPVVRSHGRALPK